MVNIDLLCIVLDEGYDKKVNFLLNMFGIKVKTISNANGTASPSVLNYFGLVETKKDFYLAIIPDYLVNDILDKLRSTFDLDSAGTGIAFVLPISSSNKYLSDVFKKSNVRESEKIVEENKLKYHLVITIITEGYLEQVMAAAKKAGCEGGTVIKGRSLGNLIPSKVLGFNIEQERDVVLNIVLEKDKNNVMEEISKAVGIKTGGKGVCISIPIVDTAGFN